MQKPDIFTQLVLCVILGLLPLAVAQTSSIPADSSNSDTHNPKTVLSAADKKFVREAAQGGLAEVELGKLATEKASNDEVKKFGQHMVDDHTKAGDELKEVASSKGIQIAQQLSAKDKLTKERLSKLS